MLVVLKFRLETRAEKELFSRKKYLHGIIIMTVGERIKKRRLELGWTQETLCIKVGLSKSFLSELESGKRNVSAENLLTIAQVFGLSLDYLMTGKGSKESKKDGMEIPIPASLVKFAESQQLSFRHTLTLLEMQRQIVAHRTSKKKDNAEKFDWRKFYEGVKPFIKS